MQIRIDGKTDRHIQSVTDTKNAWQDRSLSKSYSSMRHMRHICRKASGLLGALAFSIAAAGMAGQFVPTSVLAAETETEEAAGTVEAGSAARMYGNLHEFTAVTTEGEEITQEIFADKDITMVNCWTTWCGYCIQEMPEIAQLQEQLPDNVQIILLGLDWEDDPDYAQSLLDEAGYTGMTILPGTGNLHTFSQVIMYLPTTVFFDSEGNAIGDAIVGAPKNPAEDYLAGINAALEILGKDPVALQDSQEEAATEGAATEGAAEEEAAAE